MQKIKQAQVDGLTTGLAAITAAIPAVRRYGVTPSGTINGSNAVFTTAEGMVLTTINVWRNGILLPRTWYTVDHAFQITITTGIPRTGDSLVFDYDVDPDAVAPYNQVMVTANSTQYLSVYNGNGSITPGPEGTISFWIDAFNIAYGSASTIVAFGDRVTLDKGYNSSNMGVQLWNAAHTTRLVYFGVTNFLVDGPGTKHHFVMSWNLTGGSPVCQVYVDGVDANVSFIDGPTAGSVGWDAQWSSWFLMSHTGPGAHYTGKIADIWMDNTFNDLTTDIGKFIDGDGNPVNLGTSGENVTGSSPLIFFGGVNALSDFNSGNNRGTYGTGAWDHTGTFT